MIWKPLQDIPFQDLYFLELRSGIDNLTVFLKALGSDERILKIKFDQMVGYRVFDESSRLDSYKDSSMSEFRTSTTSDFLNWFEKESLGLFDDRDLIHYLICNTDNIIDVISTSHVTVEWVDSL
jgi:hypothetical protein